MLKIIQMATKISMYQEPNEDDEDIIKPYTINHDVFFGYKLDENLFKQKFTFKINLSLRINRK